MKLIDLHVHSTCSDGTFSPEELVLYAKSKGLSAIALTDHDTIDGIADAVQKGLEIGVIVVPGIEFSASYNNKEVHILGYYIDPQNKLLKDQLKTLVAGRDARNAEMIAKLNEVGLPLTLEDLEATGSKNTIFTRAHFAAALLEKGYVNSRDEAFSKYLGAGKPCYIKRNHLTVATCIKLIHEAGGLAVLAHPKLYGYSNQEVTQILKDLKNQGLDGVECLYCTHSNDEVTHLLQVCLNLKLFPTGGSDFHGANKPRLDIGKGYGNLKIPFELLDALHTHLGRDT